jgi:hypothetical protein
MARRIRRRGGRSRGSSLRATRRARGAAGRSIRASRGISGMTITTGRGTRGRSIGRATERRRAAHAGRRGRGGGEAASAVAGHGRGVGARRARRRGRVGDVAAVRVAAGRLSRSVRERGAVPRRAERVVRALGGGGAEGRGVRARRRRPLGVHGAGQPCAGPGVVRPGAVHADAAASVAGDAVVVGAAVLAAGSVGAAVRVVAWRGGDRDRRVVRAGARRVAEETLVDSLGTRRTGSSRRSRSA